MRRVPHAPHLRNAQRRPAPRHVAPRHHPVIPSVARDLLLFFSLPRNSGRAAPAPDMSFRPKRPDAFLPRSSPSASACPDLGRVGAVERPWRNTWPGPPLPARETGCRPVYEFRPQLRDQSHVGIWVPLPFVIKGYGLRLNPAHPKSFATHLTPRHPHPKCPDHPIFRVSNLVRASKTADQVHAVRVEGYAMKVMEGVLPVPQGCRRLSCIAIIGHAARSSSHFR